MLLVQGLIANRKPEDSESGEVRMEGDAPWYQCEYRAAESLWAHVCLVADLGGSWDFKFLFDVLVTICTSKGRISISSGLAIALVR